MAPGSAIVMASASSISPGRVRARASSAGSAALGPSGRRGRPPGNLPGPAVCGPSCGLGNHVEQDLGRQTLSGLPAVERIAVMGKEEGQFLPAVGVLILTGAEKSRSSDGTGATGRLTKTKVCSAAVTCRVREGPRGSVLTGQLQRQVLPSGPSRPTAAGSGKAACRSAPGCPGRTAGHAAGTPRPTRHKRRAISSSGVPAWLYQRRNWPRSTPLASAIAARKSSVVTAWPSCRSK